MLLKLGRNKEKKKRKRRNSGGSDERVTKEFYSKWCKFSKHPEFYSLSKNLSRKDFGKHVDLDQVSVPSGEGVNNNRWVTWWSDTGRSSNEYPDNTWMVVYDDKKRKIDNENSQYYR